ncbi:hypothetical protein ACHAWF_009155, partial [Thalassiosira exigua]
MESPIAPPNHGRRGRGFVPPPPPVAIVVCSRFENRRFRRLGRTTPRDASLGSESSDRRGEGCCHTPMQVRHDPQFSTFPPSAVSIRHFAPDSAVAVASARYATLLLADSCGWDVEGSERPSASDSIVGRSEGTLTARRGAGRRPPPFPAAPSSSSSFFVVAPSSSFRGRRVGRSPSVRRRRWGPTIEVAHGALARAPKRTTPPPSAAVSVADAPPPPLPPHRPPPSAEAFCE